MKTKILAKAESLLFYLLLIINLLPLFLYKCFFTMDGPAHLYTANIIKELISGNAGMEGMYHLHLLIPNATGDLILAVFRFFMPSWMAEKLFVVLLLTLLPLAFRTLVYSLRKKPTLLTLLIFPFTWHFLFMIGLYNYSLGIIIALFALSYYLRNRQQMQIKKWVWFTLLVLLLAFTHAFVLAVFCLVFFILFLWELWYQSKNKEALPLRFFFSQIWPWALVFLPALLLFSLAFIHPAGVEGTNKHLSIEEHLRWLFITRPLLIYSFEKEALYGIILFGALIILITGVAVNRKKTDWTKYRVRSRYQIFVACMLLLVLYFVLPDFKGNVGGNISVRFLTIFYFLFIGWLAATRIPLWFQIAGLLPVFFAGVMLNLTHIPEQNWMTREINGLTQVTKYFPAGSVVIPVNCDDNWIQAHILNYMGADNPLRILDNTVASTRGAVVWSSGSYNLTKKYGPYSLRDSALFADPVVKDKTDAFFIWKANTNDTLWPRFSRLLQQDFVPFDTVLGGYGLVYVNRRHCLSDGSVPGWTKAKLGQRLTLYSSEDTTTSRSEFVDFVKKNLDEKTRKDFSRIDARAMVSVDSAQAGDSIFLTCMLKRGKSNLFYFSVGVQADSTWQAVHFSVNLPLTTEVKDQLKIYLWNPAKRKSRIRSADVTFISDGDR